MHPGMMEELDDKSYGWRLLVVTFAGAIGALLLTWFMHELIHSSQQQLDESKRAHMVDFVRLRRTEASATRDRRPARPAPAEQPPAPATPQADTSQADTSLAIAVTALPEGIGEGLKIGGLGFDTSDGEYLPIVKIAPIYPHRAQYRGIEGECVVMYTVTISGSTRDVMAIESMCTDKVFYLPSIEAAKKFKYKPRIIDGEPVEVHKVKNRFIFNLPDEE